MQRARIFCVCIECPEQPAPLSRPLSRVQGLDYSLYNQFCAPSYEQIRLSTLEHRYLTDVAPVLDFDFCNPNMPTEREKTEKHKVHSAQSP